ncbi:unnamed protein product [Rotaria sp. Silwood1]|nr:unnamed protein product [Rotaria sp. Silwood1]
MDQKKSTATVCGSSSSLSSSTTTNKRKSSSSVLSSSTTTNKRKSSSSVLSSTSGSDAVVSNSESTKNTRSDTVIRRPVRQVLQNFPLIWLDTDFDESRDDYKESIQHLRHIVATVTTFTDVDECIDFLSDIENEKVFMIISGTLGQYIIPQIQACPQLVSIYVFCDDQSIHERWTETIAKVKGVYTQIEPICEALQIDQGNCDRTMISMSFDGIDPLFMYTQLLKEALLDIEDEDTKSIKEFVEYCRLQDDVSTITLEKIEREYRDHSPIWWYTGPYFIYLMLNHGLRQMDVDIILKMGFFIRHLHNHIAQLHQEQQDGSMPTRFRVFRGQTLPPNHPDLAHSYNNIGNVYKNMGENFKALSSYERALEIQTIALPPNHPDLAHSYNNIGTVHQNMDEYPKALSFYERALEIQTIGLSPNHPDLANSYNNIGNVYKNMGENSKALSFYERALKIQTIGLSPNHPDLAHSYNNIGNVYKNMGENSKALSSYERALEIQTTALPPNHPDLARSYNNMGDTELATPPLKGCLPDITRHSDRSWTCMKRFYYLESKYIIITLYLSYSADKVHTLVRILAKAKT